MIMKAEEYIEKVDTKPFHFKDRYCANHNIKAFAYRAVIISKIEEREKANSVINGTITYIESEIENGRNISAKNIFDVFNGLLNKK